MLSNIEFTSGLVLVLSLLFLLARNIIKMNRANNQLDGLDTVRAQNNNNRALNHSLFDHLGQLYSPPSGHGIEPNDSRFHTTSLVIPEQLPVTHENVKHKFLTDANLTYLDWENDQLNINLVNEYSKNIKKTKHSLIM